MELASIQNLTFTYPEQSVPVLKDVSLSLRSGDFAVLAGPSGCGKSTLLRQLKTVLAPHGYREGRVLLRGKPVDEIPASEQAARIGFVMQSPDSQIVTDRVWHELAFGLESLGVGNAEIRGRVAEMASFFGIQTWFHMETNRLSGGQKQLLNLASIMVLQPELLILDEPTSQLDPIAATDFLQTLGRINRELGTTILITEHRLEDIYHAADRVVVMEKGKVVANDTLLALFEGIIRILIFLSYVVLISLMKDIHRVYQYHGAEHKSVHCQESDLPLTPENAKTFSRLHPRCGTAFLLIVFSISIILFLILNNTGASGASESTFFGLFMMFLNSLSFSLYLGIFKPVIAKYSVVTFMKWIFLFSALMAMPMSFREVISLSWTRIPSVQLWELGHLIVFATFISYFLIPVGQKRIRPTLVSMYSYIQPIIATVISIIIGMDILTWQKLLAAGLVFFGVFVVSRSPSAAK